MTLLDYNNVYWKLHPQKFQILINCVKSHWRHYEIFLKNHYPEVVFWIDQSLPQLADPFFKFKTKAYWILNGLTSFPKCKECNREMNDKNVRSLRDGYKDHCSHKCSANCEEKKAAIVETSLKNWGTTTPIKNEKLKLIVQNRFKIKYGVQTPMQVPKFKKNFENSMLKKHGGRYTFECHGIEVKRKYHYAGIEFDSMPEIAFFIWLNDNGIPFEFHPSVSFDYEVDGRTYKYFPDFKLFDSIFVELKGLQFFKNKDPSSIMVDPYNSKNNKKAEAKHQCMLANRVHILTLKDYKFYMDYVAKKYGAGYLKQFK